MDAMRIEISEADRYCLPGGSLRGGVQWNLEKPPERVELRLFHYTEGKGTQDVVAVETRVLAQGVAQGGQTFEFALPVAPYSFSGRLISLIWAVELVAMPSGGASRREFVVSPTGQEIILGVAE